MAKKADVVVAPTVSKDYQAEDDARTLSRAGEVRADKSRHKQAVKHLSKQADAASKAAMMEMHARKGLAAAFGSKKPCAKCDKADCKGCNYA